MARITRRGPGIEIVSHMPRLRLGLVQNGLG